MASNLLWGDTWGSKVVEEGVASDAKVGLTSNPPHLFGRLPLPDSDRPGTPPPSRVHHPGTLAHQGFTPPGNLLLTSHDASQSLHLLALSHHGEQTTPLRTGGLPDALPRQRRLWADPASGSPQSFWREISA